MISKAYDIFFETLANRRRLKIIEAIKGGPKTVSQIVGATGLEQSNVSHNLGRLYRCGFVTVKRDGKNKIYSLNKKTLEPLVKLIDLHVNKFCRHCLQDRN